VLLWASATTGDIGIGRAMISLCCKHNGFSNKSVTIFLDLHLTLRLLRLPVGVLVFVTCLQLRLWKSQ
jgi:hypothetical protein